MIRRLLPWIALTLVAACGGGGSSGGGDGGAIEDFDLRMDLVGFERVYASSEPGGLVLVVSYDVASDGIVAEATVDFDGRLFLFTGPVTGPRSFEIDTLDVAGDPPRDAGGGGTFSADGSTLTAEVIFRVPPFESRDLRVAGTAQLVEERPAS